METKQTPVEWLEKEFVKFLNWQSFSFNYRSATNGNIKDVKMYTSNDFLKAIEKAKEMEKDKDKRE